MSDQVVKPEATPTVKLPVWVFIFLLGTFGTVSSVATNVVFLKSDIFTLSLKLSRIQSQITEIAEAE